jgi:uncharacterized protein YprB with RNaseH-like and TPR domain
VKSQGKSRRSRNVLVIDTGQDIVGIFTVRKNTYRAYRGRRIAIALKRISTADEIVTFNGKHRDLSDLAKFAALPENKEFPLSGIHSDMRSICWSDRIWGSRLECTYLLHNLEVPDFPATHEGSNERDVHMTYHLWRLWKDNKLLVLDGVKRGTRTGQ